MSEAGIRTGIGLTNQNIASLLPNNLSSNYTHTHTHTHTHTLSLSLSLSLLNYPERSARSTSPLRLSFAISHSNEFLNRKINISEQSHSNQESIRLKVTNPVIVLMSPTS
jgi:hypothetical protein